MNTLLELPNGQQSRLRTIKKGAFIGEIGFFLNTPRSASVIAEEPTTLYPLTKKQSKI